MLYEVITDTGASLVTMRHVFEDLFSYCGRNLEDFIELVSLDPVCRYFWRDGTRLDTSSDATETARQISDFAPEDADSYSKYLEDSRRIYA